MTSNRIAFLHPDLGIGGAERLVVDAALALKKKCYDVILVTTHHDHCHCFSETIDGTFKVIVVGDWLPRNIFGRFFALCAYLRMIYAATYLAFFSNINPALVFCDLVSVCIPIFNIRRIPVIFYCHHPDQLLSNPSGVLKSLYRAPLNWLEERTTSLANLVLVNSIYTQTVFKETFRSIRSTPNILYPSIPTENFLKSKSHLPIEEIVQDNKIPPDAFIYLSINRYERKKNINIAIEALKCLKTSLSENQWNKTFLVVAGGYDINLRENVEHYQELFQLAEKENIKDHVYFLKSISNEAKVSLMDKCICLLYTPPNEHYGIVPVEAMFLGKPVIAQNSGGPTETIINGKTGFLCENNPIDFSKAMKKFIDNPELSLSMGAEGRIRFEENYSSESFANQLDHFVMCVLNEKDD